MTDLWSITVAFRGSPSTMRLLYKSGSEASAAYEKLKFPEMPVDDEARGLPAPEVNFMVEVKDSYGSTVTIDRSIIAAHWMTNLGDEAEGMKDESILKAHAQASLNKRAQADPILGQQAPRIIAPQPPNPFSRPQ